MEVPDFIEDGLMLIAHAIKEKRGDTGLLTSNYGEPEFECPVFSMRTYCWCDGDRPGHEDGCPPNFQHKSGLVIEWYKYLGRGTQMNRSLTVKEWCAIMRECLEAV